MSTLYNISLRQEIMLEAYAGILASFQDYFEIHHIDPEKDPTLLPVLLFNHAIKIHNDILYKSSMAEMIQIEAQYKFLKGVLHVLELHEQTKVH